MFGENLRRYRKKKGLSQNDVAEKLFVTRQCVSKWEKGITQPDLQTLARLSDLLEVSVDALVKDDPAAERTPPARHKTGFVFNGLVAAFCLFAFLAVWNFTPQIIPAHYSNGVVDRNGNHNEILLNMLTVTVLFAVDSIVFFAVGRSRKKNGAWIAHGTVALMQIAYFALMLALYAKFLDKIIPFTLCLSADLLFCVSVAMHPKITRNGFLGVRTRETLASATVRNKTNALASYLFASCSVVIFTLNMLLKNILFSVCFAAYAPLAAAVILYAKKIGKTAD